LSPEKGAATIAIIDAAGYSPIEKKRKIRKRIGFICVVKSSSRGVIH
jgi:hypothetical protein